MIQAAPGNPGGTDSGCIRVLASRSRCGNYGHDSYHIWEPELAPSQRLMTRRRCGMSDNVFRHEYDAETQDPNRKHAFDRLMHLAAAYDVSICYDMDCMICHQILLKRLYNSG